MPGELVLRGLTKRYPNGVLALDGVSLTLGKGTFGLLGPNGAGKSTLMRTLATLQLPDAGEARLDGIDIIGDPQSLRQRLGYLPQEFGVYPGVSATELLHHLAILKGFDDKRVRVEMVDELLEKVNLYEHRKRAVSGYSGGMRQRFGIAQCLIGDPELVIVDEPTAGLDPGERNRFYNILSEIGEQVIVLLSTHIVQDVRELCERMAIMNRGHVIYDGTTDDALGLIRGRVFEKKVSKGELAQTYQRHRVLSSKLVGGTPLVHVYSDGPPEEDGVQQEGYRPAEETLEDVYFAKLNEVI